MLIEAEEDVRFPQFGVTPSCELPIGILGAEPGLSQRAVHTLKH